MSKKIRTRIPQENKIRAYLQQEINSKCPFCESKEVGHFQIHHIDENPSNNEKENLVLLCPTCHSKITKKDIAIEEVIRVKQGLKNNALNIQFITVSVDSENCGWEPYDDTENAFELVRYKSLFPIFNFSFINNSDKTVLLTNIVLTAKQLPVGLSGPDFTLPNILRPVIKYKVKLPANKKTINTKLNDEIEVPKGRAFKFQVELYDDTMNSFKDRCRYALDFKFGFNNEFYIDIPKVLLNSKIYYEQLTYTILG